MAAKPYLLQLPDANTMPARTLRNGVSAMAISAESTADALAMAKAEHGDDVDAMWDRATLTQVQAPADMSGWALRLRVVSPAGLTKFDKTVEADGTVIGITAAVGTLTSSANFSDTETVTIDGKVYTFQSVLTNVDGHVKIAATEALSLVNLKNAINLGAGVVGTDYATLTTAHTTVSCTSVTVHTAVVTARAMGTAGNALATTETSATAAWGAVTLAGGADATDKPSSLACRMMALLNASSLAPASSFDSTTHILTVAAGSAVYGDHRVFSYFVPKNADRAEVIGVPGFVVATTHNGLASAALTVELPADTYVVPKVFALLGATG